VPLEDIETVEKLDLSRFPSGSAVELSTQLDALESGEEINLSQLVKEATAEIVTPPIGLEEIEKIDLEQLPPGSTLLVGARAGTFDPGELFGTLNSMAEQHDLYGKVTNVDVRIFRSRG
jgi:hypothetical protein